MYVEFIPACVGVSLRLFRAKSFYNIIGLQFDSFYFYYRSVVAAKRKVICSKLQTTIFSRTAICFNIIQSRGTCWHVNAKMPLMPQPIWYPAHFGDSFLWSVEFGCVCVFCYLLAVAARDDFMLANLPSKGKCLWFTVVYEILLFQ